MSMEAGRWRIRWISAGAVRQRYKQDPSRLRSAYFLSCLLLYQNFT